MPWNSSRLSTLKRASSSLLCLFCAPVSAAYVLSDRVVILDSDARSHTVQHTLATDTALVTLDLPRSVTPQRILFGGPERVTFTQANLHNPQRMTLWSGNAFARYRHQYGESVTQLDEGSYRLTTQSWPSDLQVELEAMAPEAIESVQTWVFPANAEVLNWQFTAAAEDVPGEWEIKDNTLVWTQTGDSSTELQIDYRIKSAAHAPPLPKSAVAEAVADTQSDDDSEVDIKTDDETLADVDEDGIPDQRDACLQAAIDVDLLGCSVHTPRVLDEVRFSRGQSYLDLDARAQLTRTAEALIEHPDTVWQIAGYTDNRGSRRLNRELSTRRAETVRDFLLLRGVAPGRLHATGYGEESPLADNATYEGQQANRRIELLEWDPDTRDASQ